MRLSVKEATSMGIVSPSRQSKYKNEKTIVNGITFDSMKEATYYAELVMKKKAGIIAKIELQPAFVLQEGYRTKSGEKVREIKYVADFKVTYPDGKIQIVDTKGYRTKEYKLKKKMLLFRYPDINFIEI
jgi:protein associated with RNAse G/E